MSTTATSFLTEIESGLSGGDWKNIINTNFYTLSTVGSTINRPVNSSTSIGQSYFDTTLNIPVWYNSNSSTGWINATGTAV